MDFSYRLGPNVDLCETILGYSFESKILCAEALNAAADHQATYTLDGVLKKMPKNDRLAVYGDTAAAFHLASIWMQRGLDKQSWTTIRNDLVSNENLARVGREHGLDACIKVNGGTVWVSPGMVATAVEAILGAVETDGGHEAFVRVMAHLGLTQHALFSSVPPWKTLDALMWGLHGHRTQSRSIDLDKILFERRDCVFWP